MKKLIYLFTIALLIFASCVKDFTNDVNLDLKKAKVSIPFKGSFCTNPQAPDPSKPYGFALITGTATHFGEFITEKSYMYYTGQTQVSGVMTAANGDGITWVHDLILTPNPDGTVTVTGIVTVTGGTGRFEGISGTFNPIGKFNPLTGVVCSTFDGMLEYQ